MALLQASCEKLNVSAHERPGWNENVLRFDVSAPLGALDPYSGTDSGSNNVYPLLYGYLCVLNDGGVLEPDLAVDWKYDRERFTWTIRLRSDARFHDGRKVTAQDVKYSLEKSIECCRHYLNLLVGSITAIDDDVIIIALKEDDPEFLDNNWSMEIVPEQRAIDWDGRMDLPVGSGPFKFQYRKGRQEIGLTANEEYFRGRPNLDGVVFIYQPNKRKSCTRLLAGKTDIVEAINPDDYDKIKRSKDKFYFHSYVSSFYEILLYNRSNPLFNDIMVRQALAYAIDRDHIVKKVLNGFGVVAAGPAGVDSRYRCPQSKPLPYDPQISIRLLEKAGWKCELGNAYLMKDGEPFEFRLNVLKDDLVEERVAQFIRLSLNQIGIKMHIVPLDFNDLLGSYHENGSFDAMLIQMTGAYANPRFFSTWLSSDDGYAKSISLSQSEQVSLFGPYYKELYQDKRELVGYIDDRLIHYQPGCFLFHRSILNVMSMRFEVRSTFSLKLNGIYNLQYLHVKH